MTKTFNITYIISYTIGDCRITRKYSDPIAAMHAHIIAENSHAKNIVTEIVVA